MREPGTNAILCRAARVAVEVVTVYGLGTQHL